MYGKIKIAGHPVHPMLVAFPVAFHAGPLGLLLASMASYVTSWNGPAISATPGVVLSAIGTAATVAAGFLGWMLVQDYHVGVHLIPEQELAEPAVQHHRLSLLHHHAA